MTLRDKIEAFADAISDFRGCSEMLMSGPKSKEGQKISARFFGLREELEKIGLDLENRGGGKLTPLEAALFRWAVWGQAAGHTASLNLADPYIDRVGWPDSANIMTHLGTAEQALFEALDRE
jgi:hypothetical protein